jgi:hypothetical protein
VNHCRPDLRSLYMRGKATIDQGQDQGLRPQQTRNEVMVEQEQEHGGL